MSFKTIDLLKDAAQKWPESNALFDGDVEITYDALYNETEKLTQILSTYIKESGQGIALVTGNNKHFITGLFASSASGFVVMPVWHGLNSKEIEESLTPASINLLLIEKSMSIEFPGMHRRGHIDEFFDLIIFPNIPSENITQKFPDAAFIRPSSGTTGSSKGVVISHQAVKDRIEAANTGLKLGSTDLVLWVLPMAFHFIVSICLYIRNGAALIISNDFYAETIIRLSNKHKATLLYASPLHYRLLASYKGESKFNTLKKAICTSAGIENETIKTFAEKYNLPLSQAYGIIEIGLPLINNNKDAAKPYSVGQALKNYELAVFDNEMKQLAPNSEGVFAIKGPGMFSGYLWPFQKAENLLYKSWFLTGDIARIDEEGFVTISGREKSVINVSGNKVFPEEVESVIRLYPAVSDVRVYSGQHKLTGQIVEAEVVLKKDFTASGTEIISFCREHLSGIKIPQRITFVSQIEKTKTGKTVRA
ncbi:MAG: long-chain fatty acid--CoA ligase [Bacteroidetes bacterium]|nr:MAG: long-chain fatty acid--CoA ligase [Bacteroidota bacterium]